MSDTGATPPSPPQPGAQPGDNSTRTQTSDASGQRVVRDVPVESAPTRLLQNIADNVAENRAQHRTESQSRPAQRVEARVVEQSTDGTTRLRTDNAEEIIIRTRAKLAEGTRVILQLKIAREIAAQQNQVKPAPNQPPPQQTQQQTQQQAQQHAQRIVAEADLTILRTAPTRSDAIQNAVQQVVRVAVQQGVQIRAQFIPPLQTFQTAPSTTQQATTQQNPAQQPAAQPAAQQAPLPQTAPQQTPQQTPLQSLQQIVSQLLTRPSLPLLPPGAPQQTSPALPTINPPQPQALRALNALPASLKPLLVLLAARAELPGIGNAPLQQILARPGLPPLNIGQVTPQITPQAALPLLTGPAALFQLGQQLAAARPGIAAAAPLAQGIQPTPLQPLLQQLGIIPPQGAAQPSQAAASPAPLPLSQGPQGAHLPQAATLQIQQIITPHNLPDTPTGLRALLPQGPQILTGLVTGPDRTGNPVVATARGQFILTNAQPLTPGTVLSFSIVPDAALLKEADLPIWPLPLLEGLRGERWSAMEEAIRVLQAENTNAAQALRNIIPAPVATRFTTATLFFLAALRVGDIAAWMGQNQIQALKDAGRADLINRLSGDFGRAARQSADVLPGDWRAIPLPFMHEEQVMKIQLFMRQQRERGDKDKDGKGKSGRQTRFLIEALLSRLGAMQLDGLFTPEDKRLDLVMRTKEPLPNDIRNGMAQRYRDTVSATGLAGDLKFQARGKGWVHLDAGDGHNGNLGVNA